ncbi:MAG: hypothetical protein RL043_1470, partial [Pseudomonadota bacterium]
MSANDQDPRDADYRQRLTDM